MERGLQNFKEEAREHLAALENTLLELEESPDDSELIDSAFRSMHTLKGLSSMFGFDVIASFTHQIETVYERVRLKEIEVTKELIASTLSAHDQIRTMLESQDEGEGADKDVTDKILEAFKHMIPEHQSSSSETEFPPSSGEPEFSLATEPESPRGEKNTYRIRIFPNAEIFVNGIDPIPLLNELREFGKCQVIAQTKFLPGLEEIDPEKCYTYWDVILTTEQDSNAIRDVFIFVENDCELNIETIELDEDHLNEGSTQKRLGKILIERGDIKAEDLDQILASQQPLGKILENAGLVNPGQIQAALAEQEHAKEVQEQRQSAEPVSSIRVTSEKLDTLIDLVGELVTIQARLSQFSTNKNDPDLISIAEEVESLTSELRDNTISVRMLALGTTFNKFRRLVRDLSKELGKEVVMTTEGAETDLDKSVIEQLNDPLVHIVRNCIDHGIEQPEDRIAAGKPRKGTIHLSATHLGASVLIRIRDDGGGLNSESIRTKALERGIIAQDEKLSEKEIFQLVFSSGFSTAKNVTNVSGRGVGLDVVKRAIDALRGSVDITSKPGEGTEITLKLPLTLAIIEGLLVKISSEKYIIPLSIVRECVELTREDVAQTHGRHVANVRGTIVPYVLLREQFEIKGEPPDIEQVVVVEINHQNTGIVVDGVIGEHQTVIKPLGRLYKNVDGISGATILGDGSVALILDVNQLLSTVEIEELRMVS
ncbi:MAG: chemotaxis protein CheA [SAR324 cluster bacterium]|nr:chemotaxis protein CheA [SAR324 cluster bacterium]